MNAPLPIVATGIHCLDVMPIEELIDALESNTYPGASRQSIKLVVANCRAQQLDPLTKPFHIVPMRVKQVRKDAQGKEVKGKHDFVWRDVIMPGIELYRIKAARTGEYVGIADAKWGEAVTETLGGEPKTEWDEAAQEKVDKGKKWESAEITFHEWCEITVYRFVKGEPRAFSSGRVYFEETYATAAEETSLPNRMWMRRPKGQHEKCAEALALRRAFPEVGGAPTREEMEGKVLEHTYANVVEGTVTERTVEQPKPVTESGAPAAATTSANPSEAGAGSGGGAPDAGKLVSFKPLIDGQRRMLKARLGNAKLTEVDLEAAFPGKKFDSNDAADGFAFSDYNALETWISKNAKP